MDAGLGVIGMIGQVFINAEQGETPGAWRGERGDDGEADTEELGAEVAMAFVAGAAGTTADGPEGAAVAVFATGFLEPLSAMAHEVAETACFIV